MAHDATPNGPDRVRIEGPIAAPPVLLVSGLGGTAAFWSPVQSRLAARFRVASYDQPGCGTALPQDGPVTIDSLAQDAAAISRSVFGDRAVTVIGHSTGGAIAQTLAATWPDLVARLVLSGTWQTADPYMVALFGYRADLLRKAPALAAGLSALLARDPEEIGPGDLAPAPMTPGAIAATLARIDALLAFDGSVLAGRIRAPALVIGAADDRIVPVSRQRALHAALPESMLRILPDGGHFFPISRHDRFVADVKDWLAGTKPDPAQPIQKSDGGRH
jgi:aminoacrylate hydrolase